MPSNQNLALRHIQALRNGRPFSWVNFNDKFAFFATSQSVSHQLRLKGKHIAYLRGNAETRESNTVVVRDLVTGQAISLCGNAREKIMSIELTTDFVAFFTYVGTFYVASVLHLAAPLKPVRLPSSSIIATGADRGTLACILRGAPTLAAVIYDTRVRKSTSFNLQNLHDGDEAMDCYAILVNSHTLSIDIFTVVKDNAGLAVRVKVSRYSLAGDFQTHTSLTIWHGLQDLKYVTLGSALPTGERGLYQLDFSYGGSKVTPGPYINRNVTPRTPWICSRSTLLFDTSAVTLKAIDNIMNIGRFEPGTYPNTALWKDRRYRSEDSFPCPIIETARRRESLDGPHTLRWMNNEAKAAPIRVDMEPDDEALSNWKHCKTARSEYITTSDLEPWLRHNQAIPEPIVRSAGTRPTTADRQGQDCDGPPATQYFHTIVTMNDTFAVGTCFNCDYIGVLCFDERVLLHGATQTTLWHDPYSHSSDDVYRGPALLPMKRGHVWGRIGND